jgi:hypothetical protein
VNCPEAYVYPELGVECVDPEACQGGMPCTLVRRVEMDKRSMGSDEKDVNPEWEHMADQLRDWWLKTAEVEIARTAPKAVEYSSIDLIEYGRTLAVVVMGRPNISEEEATEIGIWGYLVGKVARWSGAIKDNRRPSDDTLLDISIYTKMAQRNREVGGWPFASEERDTHG